MDHYEALGIDPSFDGDLRVVRNRLVKQYSEAGATPDEERMKAINLAYETLRDRPAPLARVVFRGGAGSVVRARRAAVRASPARPASPRRSPPRCSAPARWSSSSGGPGSWWCSCWR